LKLSKDVDLKFDVGDVVDYTGSDLVFLVGAPGVRWSVLFKAISESKSVNTSDWVNWEYENTIQHKIKNFYGEVITAGSHRGTYWGPYNKYGQEFDQLNKLSKAEMILEFQRPFENWSGTKVIKSHWFAYHIDHLHGLFPDAKIVSCYANDMDCFFWWKKCGGWGMFYPKYNWYQNDENLISKIKEENYRLLKFNQDRDVPFEWMTRNQLCDKLGIEQPESEDVDLWCKVAVHDKRHIRNFRHIIN
jgi:hypothetical protein